MPYQIQNLVRRENNMQIEGPADDSENADDISIGDTVLLIREFNQIGEKIFAQITHIQEEGTIIANITSREALTNKSLSNDATEGRSIVANIDFVHQLIKVE